jgi:hypothetical protein
MRLLNVVLCWMMMVPVAPAEIYQDAERLGVFTEEAVLISSDLTDDLRYARVRVPTVSDGHVVVCFKKREEVKIHCIYVNDKTKQAQVKDVLTDNLDI